VAIVANTARATKPLFPLFRTLPGDARRRFFYCEAAGPALKKEAAELTRPIAPSSRRLTIPENRAGKKTGSRLRVGVILDLISGGGNVFTRTVSGVASGGGEGKNCRREKGEN